MLDIKYIRENSDKIREAIKNKNIKLNLDELLKLDDSRRELQQQIDTLRTRRNEIANMAKGGKPTQESIDEGKKLKEEISILEEKLREIDDKYDDLMCYVPIIPSDDTPIGKDENENVEILKWGEPRKFDFEMKDHLTLGKELDIIDMERGTKVAGYRGYYIKNEGVMLQMGVMMYAMEKLISKGFKPFLTPTLIKEFSLWGSGYFSGKGYNDEIDEIYQVASGDKEADGTDIKERKFLIGTAEPALLGYHSGEVLNLEDLPLKMCGFSMCYRSEIGSYGKDVKGMYRVHEFMKIEQVAICPQDDEIAEKLHQEMLGVSKELHEDLGLPYRVIQLCTGDMGKGKYKMFDIEAWIPSRNGYGETGSASNLKDFQSRRLNIKYNDKDGTKKFAYMLNDTALASARTMIAIIENYQQADGSIIVPEVLRKYVGKDKIGGK